MSFNRIIYEWSTSIQTKVTKSKLFSRNSQRSQQNFCKIHLELLDDSCWREGHPLLVKFSEKGIPPSQASHLYRKKGIISLTGYLYNVYKELRTISRSWLPGHSPSPSPSPSFYLSLSPRPSDQLSEKSNVSTTVTRSPIELSWTAKKQKKIPQKG